MTIFPDYNATSVYIYIYACMCVYGKKGKVFPVLN